MREWGQLKYGFIDALQREYGDSLREKVTEPFGSHPQE